MHYSCYDLHMGQSGRGVHVPLAPCVVCLVDHYGFASFVFGWAFHSTLTYFVYRYCAEIDRSSMGKFPCWIPYGFADGQVRALV